MSDLRVNSLRGRTPGSSPTLTDGVVVSGVSTFNNNVTVDGGDITLTSQGDKLVFSNAASNPASGGCIEIQTSATSTATIRGSSNQLLIYNDDNSTNSFDLRAPTYSIMDGNADYYALFYQGACKLYHPNTAGGITDQKFETTADGIAVAGVVTATSGIVTYYGDGSNLTGIQVGTRDFVGFGTISARDPVGIRSDGTVGVITSTGGTGEVGTEVQYVNNASFDQASVYSTPDNKTVLIYRDYGDSGKGKSVVATVSGSSVSFGGVVGFSTGETRGTSIAYDPDADKVIAHYIDNDDGNQPYVVVGEMQGNGTISWGTPYRHYANSTTGMTDCVYDTQNDKIVLIWGNTQGGELKTFAGGVNSDNSVSLGGSQEIGDSDNTPDKLTALWHVANSRVVVFFEDIDDSNKGFYSVGVYNTNNQYTWTSPTQFTTGPIDVMKSVYDSTNDRIIFAYRDTGNSNYGTARVGSLSGNTITWGNDVVFNSGDTEEISMDWDSTNERVIIGYKDAGNSDKGMFVSGTISGANKRTITFSNETVFNDSSISSLSLTFDSNTQKSLIMFSDGGLSGDGKGVVVNPGSVVSTNLTTENYIGLAVAGISSGSTGSITIPGGISSGHSGLTTGRTYYVQPGGDLQLSAGNPSVVAGTSISDTEILVR